MALFGVSIERQEALGKAGQDIPQPVALNALVDTGASCTAVDSNVIQRLGLTPTGVAKIATPSTEGPPLEVAQYDVSIIIPPGRPGDRSFVLAVLPVIEVKLEGQYLGYTALIGRDILDQCLFIYDGLGKVSTLAF